MVPCYWSLLGDEKQNLSCHFRGISATGLLPLVYIEGNLDADGHIALFERHVIDYINDDWLFQQDNAPGHVSERTKAGFLSAIGVQLLR